MIMPIYKKGSDGPRKPSPSPLSTTGKLCAAMLFGKRRAWAEENNIVGNEQANFRKRACTIDHCHLLQYLADKCMSSGEGILKAAFVDLNSAFNTISRPRLWEHLKNYSIEPSLLQLYRHSTAQVRCGE